MPHHLTSTTHLLQPPGLPVYNRHAAIFSCLISEATLPAAVVPALLLLAIKTLWQIWDAGQKSPAEPMDTDDSLYNEAL